MLPVDKNQKMSAVLAGVPILIGALISLEALRHVSFNAGSMALVVLLAFGGAAGLAGKYLLSPHTGFGITLGFPAAIIFTALFSTLRATTVMAIRSLVNEITQSNASCAEELTGASRLIMGMAKELSVQVTLGNANGEGQT